MAVTQRNSNAAMILLFLYRLVEVRRGVGWHAWGCGSA